MANTPAPTSIGEADGICFSKGRKKTVDKANAKRYDMAIRRS